MTENLRFSFQGIWAHKLRSFLTMLGVIIGIASIIAIVSTIEGTNQQIMDSMIGAGNNNVKISLKQGEGDYFMDGGLPVGVPPVTAEQKEEIRALPHVEDATFYMKRDYINQLNVNGKETMGGASIAGVDTHYLNTTAQVVYDGRAFAEDDYAKFRKVALLDENAEQSLFPDGGALGAVIEINGEPFRVVGLYRKSDSFQPRIETISDYYTYYGADQMGKILIPSAVWPAIYAYDEPENAIARADKPAYMADIGRKAAEILNQGIVKKDGEEGSAVSYKADDLMEQAKKQQELSASTNNLLIWIASIALLVGGIGVMNIMLVSVTERTSEIGLKKALGARKRRILAQFLTESVVLTSLGGVLGVIAGIILAKVISTMTATPMAISIPSIFLGVGFSMLIGIVFGLLPSIKASNLNPIDALRRE